MGAELKVRHIPIYWDRIPLDHENPLNCRCQMITNSKKIFQNFSVGNILANARHWDSEWTLPSVFMYTFSRVLKIEKIRKLPNTWFRPENSIIAKSLTFWKTRMKISISCSQYMKMLILAFDKFTSIFDNQIFFFLFNSIVLKCSSGSIIDRLEKCSYFKKVHCIFNAHKQYVYRLVLDRTTIKQTSILFVVIDDRSNPRKFVHQNWNPNLSNLSKKYPNLEPVSTQLYYRYYEWSLLNRLYNRSIKSISIKNSWYY